MEAKSTLRRYCALSSSVMRKLLRIAWRCGAILALPPRGAWREGAHSDASDAPQAGVAPLQPCGVVPQQLAPRQLWLEVVPPQLLEEAGRAQMLHILRVEHL